MDSDDQIHHRRALAITREVLRMMLSRERSACEVAERAMKEDTDDGRAFAADLQALGRALAACVAVVSTLLPAEERQQVH